MAKSLADRKAALVRWLNERGWWFRYLVTPAIAASPTFGSALYLAMHKNSTAYWWKDNEPILIAAAGVLGAVLAAMRTGLSDISTTNVKEMADVLDDWIRLVGHVRCVVTAKSKRFFEALAKSHEWTSSGDAFRVITQPETQIGEIVRGIHDFYCAKRPGEERVTVSLMRWDDSKHHLVVKQWWPPSASPCAPATSFNDSTTAAGKAYFGKETIVCEDVDRDQSYRKLSTKIGGSMFAYPVKDDLENRVHFVVNVASSAKGRFKSRHRPGIDLMMEVFADRLILENRLATVRDVSAKQQGAT